MKDVHNCVSDIISKYFFHSYAITGNDGKYSFVAQVSLILNQLNESCFHGMLYHYSLSTVHRMHTDTKWSTFTTTFCDQ